MTFIKGDLCELRALDPEDEYQVCTFTEKVNAGLTTKFLFTGSIPCRTKDYQNRWIQELKAGDIPFGIWVKDQIIGDKMIGTCGLHDHKDVYRSWEFRILIYEPEFLGKGIGEEACRLTTGYAFHRLNAHRVWLGYNEENIGAGKCYEKVGYKREGSLRDAIFCYGKYVNAIRMSVLEEDWKSLSTAKAQ